MPVNSVHLFGIVDEVDFDPVALDYMKLRTWHLAVEGEHVRLDAGQNFVLHDADFNIEYFVVDFIVLGRAGRFGDGTAILWLGMNIIVS